MTTLLPVKQVARLRRRRGRPRRDFKGMEQRRMQAADPFEEGVIPAEIARRVGVRHQIVSQWRKAWRQDGRAGRKRKPTEAQLATVAQPLANRAAANGYTTD